MHLKQEIFPYVCYESVGRSGCTAPQILILETSWYEWLASRLNDINTYGKASRFLLKRRLDEFQETSTLWNRVILLSCR